MIDGWMAGANVKRRSWSTFSLFILSTDNSFTFNFRFYVIYWKIEHYEKKNHYEDQLGSVIFSVYFIINYQYKIYAVTFWRIYKIQDVPKLSRYSDWELCWYLNSFACHCKINKEPKCISNQEIFMSPANKILYLTFHEFCGTCVEFCSARNWTK